MNRAECQKLIDAYVEWLRQGISAEEIGEACELTTPFLDRHNDHLQVYATRRNGNIILSDDGYILSDLRTSGLEIDTPKRKMVLDSTLKGLGVRMENGQLVVEASAANLGQRLHSLVQAMLAVNDMFVMAQPRVASFFFEDVRNFLDSHQIRYTARVKLAGKSGYDHGVDFLIPKSPKRPERILQAIATPKKDNIFAYLWTLSDTRAARAEEAEAEAYAFLNDQEQTVGGDVIEALEAYTVKAVPWSRRDEYVQELAA
ncbi:MAG TPA: DUF1828 domain-containing protein [Bryobacteraceae bacterium]|nr:DUF1828 domain-containing protein [Bryobacteraceae bacterium]